MSGRASRRKGHFMGVPLSHGHCINGSESPTYKSYRMMLTRCCNPNYDKYPEYGGRGISVCERWDTFERFLADMGERPAGTSLDRIDPNGNYEPGNCRWASHKVQMGNRRPRVERLINGEALTAAQAIAKYGAAGVTKDCVERRVRRLGWAFDVAVMTPPMAVGRPARGGGK